jgi:opacity protein-like surface antigen
MSKTPRSALMLLSFLALIVIHSPAWAQVEKYNYNDDEGPGFNSGTRLILGYAANISNQYLGFTLGFTRPRTWGIFLDYKMNTASLGIAPYLYDYTVAYVETVYTADTLKDTRNSWISVNAGVTWPVSDRFCSYLGLGLSFNRAYRQYYEPYGNMGDHGYYWINDETNSTVNLNVAGGVYYKLGRYFYLQLGGDLKPLGLAAGLGLAL